MCKRNPIREKIRHSVETSFVTEWQNHKAMRRFLGTLIAIAKQSFRKFQSTCCAGNQGMRIPQKLRQTRSVGLNKQPGDKSRYLQEDRTEQAI